ncbi:MAG: choice-of-anchor D domain-containing protein [Deltaproteobacteria bacterium]|nr:choice-of-anchor D domain-containing protein [Deltaproteobacteria bacterium]
MTSPRSTVLFSLVLVYLASINCECDGGGGLQQSAPSLELYFIGTDPVPPDASSFESMPDSAELSIAYETTDVDTINRRYLMLRNTGLGELKVSDVSLTPESSPDFSVNCGQDGIFSACNYSTDAVRTIIPGQDLILEVAYVPRDVGADTGTLTVSSDARDHKTVTVNLTGDGVTPEIQVCFTDCVGDQSNAECSGGSELCNEAVTGEMQLLFGEVDMDMRRERVVTVRNLGDRPLQITTLGFISGDYSQFALDMGGADLPGILDVGATADLTVAYDPGTGGNHSAVLRVASNDVNEREIDIMVNGQGMAPRVCPDPLRVDFGNVPTGEMAVEELNIFNCGLMDLDLMNVELTADSSGDFSLVNTPSLPANVRPGESVAIPIQYYPQSQGTDAGGLAIYSDDPTSSPSTHLTGVIGIEGASFPRACDIAAVPFAVTFGSVVVGTPTTVTVGVVNQGSDTCTLNSSEISTNSADNEFSIVSAPSADTEFAPGDTLQIVLQYHPSNLGQDTGTLSLFGTDKDGNEVRVDLNGQGVDEAVCDLIITPDIHNFGMQRVNHTEVLHVNITNLGQEPCSVTGAEIRQSMMTPGDFSLEGLNLPMVINPGATDSLEVVFAPDHPGSHAAYLVIATSDPDLSMSHFRCQFAMIQPLPGQACIPLTGSSEEAAIAVVPDELDFSIVEVGCNSPEMAVTVYNLGTIALNISSIYLQTSPDPNFSLTSAPTTPHVLAGGGSVVIRMKYHPQDVSNHFNVLRIESDASNYPVLEVPLFGSGTTDSSQEDVFHQPDEVMSDVLFVVDNSGSMGEEQAALANNFDTFIQYALSLAVDFHIGVVTTEVNDSETNMGDPGRDIFPGVLVHPSNLPRFITNTTPDISNAFRDIVQVGTCCSDEQEAGLEAAYMALSAPIIDDPTKNGGFLREDAKLYVIIVSDEPDQSNGDTDFYVDFFSSIKGYRNPERMAVSAIVGDTPDGCQGPGGNAAAGPRYIDVTNRTGGAFESICTNNWAQALSSLGLDAFAAIREFPLSRPADASTLTVTVNGSTVSQASSTGGADGWTYYPDTNTIFFGDNVVPGQGDTIVVSYEAVCYL